MSINISNLDNNNREFITSSISGRLKRFEQGGGSSWFMIDKSKEKYYFWDKNNKLFYDIAKKGDSVYKTANSDTLYLIQSDSNVVVFIANKFYDK